MSGTSNIPTKTVGNIQATTQFQNIQNLNPYRYLVNSGDVFFAKIDVPGPDYMGFEIPVTGEGFALLPQGHSVLVKGKRLLDVYTSLKNELLKLYKNGLIEVYLKQPRIVKINVDVGKVKRVAFTLPATFKVSEVPFLLQLNADTSSAMLDSLLSRRFIVLFRSGKIKKVDLFRIYFLQDTINDVYIENGDYFYIPLKEDLISSIYVSGEINKPGYYEYNRDDTFSDLVIFAGGLRENADSNRIEIYRKNKGGLRIIHLKKNQWSDFKLKAGDRVYIRSAIHPDTDWRVTIKGEVVFPGEYSIIDDQTTIYEIIQKAGGFTERASLNDALVIRKKFIPKDKEFARLRMLSVEEMSRIEKSYFKIRSRQNIRKVVCNFENLFLNNQMEENITLRDGDVIIIPPKNPVVIISGGVMDPGVQTYREGYNFKKYIALAGGFNPRAIKSKVKIIKSKEGLWLDAKEEIQIEPGDIIFIPEKEERDWWEMFKEGLTVVTQLGTLAVIIINLKKI